MKLTNIDLYEKSYNREIDGYTFIELIENELHFTNVGEKLILHLTDEEIEKLYDFLYVRSRKIAQGKYK